MFKIKIFNRYYDFIYVSSFIEATGLMVLILILYRISLMRDFNNITIIMGTFIMTFVCHTLFSVATSNIEVVLYEKGILEKKEF